MIGIILFCVIPVLAILIALISGKISARNKKKHEHQRSYERHKNHYSNYIELTYKDFVQYYLLNPSKWWVKDWHKPYCFKVGYSETMFRNIPTIRHPITSLMLEYFPSDRHGYDISLRYDNIQVVIKTFKDYLKVIEYINDIAERNRITDTNEENQKKQKAKNELTIQFLESVTQDFEKLQKQAQKEIEQANQVWIEVNDRLKGGG